MVSHRIVLSPVVLFFFVTLSTRAFAGPADTDEPLLSPRAERDPRLDLPEPRAPTISSLRAPVWIALGVMLRQASTSEQSADPRSADGRSAGAMILLGLPIERVRALRGPLGIADDPAKPALKPPPRAKTEAPPTPPKLPPAPPTDAPPLRIPVVISPATARGAVDAALRHARLSDPDARVDSMIARARGSSALPEFRLRVLRSVDQGQALAPTEYDPTRTTATTGSSLWVEARATWRLDRLIFAEEELSLERMRHERAEARAKLTSRVLKLLFEWQRALAQADNASASPEENLSARLKALEAEAEIDLLTDGWLTRFRASQEPRAPRVTG